jgi:hypothetical protein
MILIALPAKLAQIELFRRYGLLTRSWLATSVIIRPVFLRRWANAEVGFLVCRDAFALQDFLHLKLCVIILKFLDVTIYNFVTNC